MIPYPASPYLQCLNALIPDFTTIGSSDLLSSLYLTNTAYEYNLEMSSHKTTNFLNLPAEIRIMIYSYVAPKDIYFDEHGFHGPEKHDLAMLRTCPQIHIELFVAMIRDTTFHVFWRTPQDEQMFRRIQIRYQHQVIFANVVRIKLYVGPTATGERVGNFLSLIDGAVTERINWLYYFECFI